MPITLSPAELEWAQAQLTAQPVEIDLFDLLTELDRSPEDPELLGLFYHYFYFSEM